MSMSGVELADDIKTEFESMKLRKTYSYMLLKISDDKKKVVIDKTRSPSDGTDQEGWECLMEDLKAALGNEEGRYVIYDFPFGAHNKLIFAAWIPDTLKIKPKMLYAATVDAVKKPLNGLQKAVQWSDFDDAQEAKDSLAKEFSTK